MIRPVFWLLLLLPVAAFAAEHACFQGEWQFDAGGSDNPERLLKKMQRKLKQQERVLSRPRIGGNDALEDLSLPDTIPQFVFLTDDIQIEIKDDTVLLRQESLQRSLDTRGVSVSLSLKSLQQNSNAVVAGWEGENLVIETTVASGSRVTETYSLPEPDTLRLDIVIKNDLEEDETLMEKVYQRTSTKSPACFTQAR